MSKKKKRHVQDPAQRRRRHIILIITAVLLAIIAAVVWYLLARYHLNTEYTAFLRSPEPAAEGSAFTPIAGENHVPGFKLVAENEKLQLYAREDTGEIAVFDLRNGSTVYSNPQKAAEDPLANNTNKNMLRSQFIIDYFNASKTSGTYDSYSWSTERGQMTAESIENGVRFIYDVGNKTMIDYYVPTYLSVEKYQEYVGMLRTQAEELEAESQAKYESGDDDAGKALHRQAQSVNADANFVEAQYNKGTPNANGLAELIPATSQIKNPPQPRGNRAKLFGILEPLGMNEDVYWEQMELAGVEEAEEMGFIIAVDYRLADDGLEVSVPADMIRESGGGKISMLSLLPYMGAADTAETGYIVLPNGCGSLIRFNNGKQNSASVYNQYIYDIDLVDADYTQIQNTVSAHLALFGICRENSSVLATIEEGAALARLTADVSGRANSYNYCYPVFKLRGDTSLEMYGASGAGGNEMHLIEEKLYDVTPVVRYTLLGDGYTGYSGLANYYRERLIGEGILSPSAQNDDIPFYYDIIGGVKETAHVLGIQYLRILPMTTFAQAQKIASTLREQGITRQIMNFTGWFNGGYYHDVADRIKVLGQLGGKRQLESLSDALRLMGGEIYTDVAFQKVTSISKRYISGFEGARDGAGYLAMLGQVNPTTLRRTSNLGYRENSYTLISPRFLHRYVQAFARGISGYDTDGISLRDLGNELHADKRRLSIISREQSLDIVKTQMDVLAATGKKLMYSDANDYAFTSANHIVNAPLSATAYFLQDETIPLYEMILHGCVEYSSDALNVSNSGDWRSEYLKLIEYGASCRYLFTWENASDMKYTALNVYSSTTFTEWYEDAVAAYDYINGALAPVSGCFMTEHTMLEEGVVRVTYSNDTKIYINYNSVPVTADGLTIPAGDYLLKGGERP